MKLSDYSFGQDDGDRKKEARIKSSILLVDWAKRVLKRDGSSCVVYLYVGIHWRVMWACMYWPVVFWIVNCIVVACWTQEELLEVGVVSSDMFVAVCLQCGCAGHA